MFPRRKDIREAQYPACITAKYGVKIKTKQPIIMKNQTIRNTANGQATYAAARNRLFAVTNPSKLYSFVLFFLAIFCLAIMMPIDSFAEEFPEIMQPNTTIINVLDTENITNGDGWMVTEYDLDPDCATLNGPEGTLPYEAIWGDVHGWFGSAIAPRTDQNVDGGGMLPRWLARI